MRTIKEINEEMDKGKNVIEKIEIVLSIRYSHPPRPIKPKINVSTPTLASQYSKSLEKYEEEIVKYNEVLHVINENNWIIEDVIIKFIKEESGLTSIPTQYQDKVYSKAYQSGHSSGFYSVYQELVNLVEIFE